MRQRVFVGGLFVVFVSLTAEGLFAQQATIERGQKVYADQKCAVCHAIGGKGNQKGALDGVGSKLSANDTRSWIVSAPEMAAKAKADRKPLMKSYTAIPKEDLDALVAYLQTLKK